MQHQDTVANLPPLPEKGGGARFALSLPAKPEYVGLSRLAVGSLGTIVGLDAEAIADLKIAMTEACALAMGHGTPAEGGSVTVDISLGDGVWRVEVAGPSPLGAAGGSEGGEGGDTGGGDTSGQTEEIDPSAVSFMLIEAFADDVAVERRDGRTILRFSKRVP